MLDNVSKFRNFIFLFVRIGLFEPENLTSTRPYVSFVRLDNRDNEITGTSVRVIENTGNRDTR